MCALDMRKSSIRSRRCGETNFNARKQGGIKNRRFLRHIKNPMCGPAPGIHGFRAVCGLDLICTFKEHISAIPPPMFSQGLAIKTSFQIPAMVHFFIFIYYQQVIVIYKKIPPVLKYHAGPLPAEDSTLCPRFRPCQLHFPLISQGH